MAAAQCIHCKRDSAKVRLVEVSGRPAHICVRCKRVGKVHRASNSIAWAMMSEARSAPCAGCKRYYPPMCMHMHHVNPALKSFSISSARSGGQSPEKLAAELQKCIPLCANCRALQTANINPEYWPSTEWPQTEHAEAVLCTDPNVAEQEEREACLEGPIQSSAKQETADRKHQIDMDAHNLTRGEQVDHRGRTAAQINTGIARLREAFADDMEGLKERMDFFEFTDHPFAEPTSTETVA